MSYLSDEIMNKIEDHMKRQPYSIHCDVCGQLLTRLTRTTVDADMDLMIKIKPCEMCIRTAKIEGEG